MSKQILEKLLVFLCTFVVFICGNFTVAMNNKSFVKHYDDAEVYYNDANKLGQGRGSIDILERILYDNPAKASVRLRIAFDFFRDLKSDNKKKLMVSILNGELYKSKVVKFNDDKPFSSTDVGNLDKAQFKYVEKKDNIHGLEYSEDNFISCLPDISICSRLYLPSIEDDDKTNGEEIYVYAYGTSELLYACFKSYSATGERGNSLTNTLELVFQKYS